MLPLFRDHIAQQSKNYAQILNDVGYDSLVLDSGTQNCYFMDDVFIPFKENSYFSHLCPAKGPEHLAIIDKDGAIQIIYYKPDDFWHDNPAYEQEDWAQVLAVREVGQTSARKQFLPKKGKIAYIGENKALAEELGYDAEPKRLIHHLNWNRGIKTAYEVACMREATRLTALGHQAARESFFAGKSEREIYADFLSASDAIETELAYHAIIATNEKPAILHYQYKGKEKNRKTLLIDAGCRFNHYCADVTRTYARQDVHPVFQQLILDTDKFQQELCAATRAGVSFKDLHVQTHSKVFDVLKKHALIQNISQEEAFAKGITMTFLPHGLGHLLGIFVHDVSGTQKNAEGDPAEPSKEFPRLRTTRVLRENEVITIEPGIYFNPILFAEHRNAPTQKYFNWKLIDALIPFGGIRIEDNILVKKDGHENLTRHYLP